MEAAEPASSALTAAAWAATSDGARATLLAPAVPGLVWPAGLFAAGLLAWPWVALSLGLGFDLELGLGLELRRRPPGSTVAPGAAGANNVALPPQLAAVEASLHAQLAGSAASMQALSFYRIPLFLLPIYQAAAAHYGVPWQILAAAWEIGSKNSGMR